MINYKKLIKKVVPYPRKFEISNFLQAFKYGFDHNAEFLFCSSSDSNFGDILSPWIFSKLSGKKPIRATKILNIANRDVYSCIGSILERAKVRNLVIWGTGFISNDCDVPKVPKKICAVRGPLTRNIFIRNDIYCPEVYGDPALLLPKFYKPEIKKCHKLGVVAHYIDKQNENFLLFLAQNANCVHYIDIESGIENVVNEILKCERIISSSLHGLIVADAYNVPSLQVKFSDNVFGNDFKFMDYMASVGRSFQNPIWINKDTEIEEIMSLYQEYKIAIDLDLLLESCPFLESL